MLIFLPTPVLVGLGLVLGTKDKILNKLFYGKRMY